MLPASSSDDDDDDADAVLARMARAQGCIVCELPEKQKKHRRPRVTSSSSSMPTVGLAYSEEDASHVLLDGFGKFREHVEKPERTQLAWQGLVKSGLADKCVRVPPREATRNEALRCHTAEHCDALDALERAAPRQVGGWFGSLAAAKRPLGAASQGWTKTGSDMYHSPATPRAARLAAGGVLALTDRVCSGELRSGFACVRPPGHHACIDRMCGFCFLNSAAMCAAPSAFEPCRSNHACRTDSPSRSH